MIRTITTDGVYSRQHIINGVRKWCLKTSPFPATFCFRSKLGLNPRHATQEVKPPSFALKCFERKPCPTSMKTQRVVQGWLTTPRRFSTCVSSKNEHTHQSSIDALVTYINFGRLYRAVQGERVGIVCAYLAAGIDPDYREKELDHTLLHLAAFIGNAEIVGELIQAKASVHIRSLISGRLPLEEAISQGKLECCRLLIQAGSDVKSKNPQSGFTPLELACKKKNPDIVKLLLEAGAKPGIDEWGLLERSITTPEILQLLLNWLSPRERLEILEDHSMKRNTLLHIAASQGITLSVEILLKAGADPRVLNNRLQTPLELVEQRVVQFKPSDLTPQLIAEIKQDYARIIKLLSSSRQKQELSQRRKVEPAGRFC